MINVEITRLFEGGFYINKQFIELDIIG